MSENTFAQRNEELAIISREMFGDGMRLMIAAPASLTLLKDNARFFKRETFRQLRDNIAADKRLSSVPLCYRHEDGRLEVLSGNHRVQASIEAAIPHILVLVITEELDKSRRIAIQLSHNALVGEDDQSILANLWAQIESVQDKLYSGLDSESLKELGDVELVNFSTPQVPAHMVTFMFTDGEKEQLSEILDMLADAAKKSSAVHLGKADFKLGKGNAEWALPEPGRQIYQQSDLAVPSEAEPRLSKLVLMLIQSHEVKRLLEEKIPEDWTWAITTAFSRHPVSMKYRGIYKLHKRLDGSEHGGYRLNYYGRLGRWSLAEAYAEWLKKFHN